MNDPLYPISQFTLLAFAVSYVIFIVVAVRSWQRERNDPTRALPLPPIPLRIDPYQIACLRGESALAPIAIVQLTDLGFLRVETRKRRWWNPKRKYIVQAESHPEPSSLSALERSVFDWFAPGRKLEEVFKDGELSSMLRVHASRYQEELLAEQLLNPEPWKEPASLPGLFVLGGVLALSIAVFPWILPLPILLIFAIGSIVGAFSGSGQSRMTHLGRAYLAAIEKKCEALKSSPADRGAPAVAAALFGLSILAGTSYAVMTEAFQKSGVSLSVESDGGCCGGCGCCG